MADPLIITLGCRLNAYESEVIRKNVIDVGLDDAIVVNTCAVTAEAVRQATQTIRKLRREHPASRIIVTGCAAQIEPERFAALEEVDHVVGNAEKMQPETFAGLSTSGSERVQVDDIMSVHETAGHLIDGFGSRTRAYVQVQNGCDHRCTFCIIPFGRGPSRSVPAGEVVAQIRHLVERGCREVVLTGVDITSYGADLPSTSTLGALVRQILKLVPELERLRLSSIDQVEANTHLLRAIAEEERLMPHLHLSMQSGDDMILKRMKRRHSRADAVRFCEDVRRMRPDTVFGADLIAGFPTETEAMFENSLSVIDDCGLTYLHVFPFSPRTGTPAARMPQVVRNVVKERAARLRAKGAMALSHFLDDQAGAEVELLIEQDGVGRTRQFAEMRLPTAVAAGALVRARVNGHDGQRLSGEVVA
ncbi:MAG: tRNA (N(6)-L-threonylcarbamoyladenosine(37)-C(2))-methylthiotransferase MtaB [Hyphomicrobium sp.]|uniref:tRNA (N(6)-L-threonylcarbamoyladenosine(37)-C(2))- methylthiotransferase MtaB n=1 Tax=Hyphomicrobium sp. TaxID=82 RepID=UPI001320C7C8|nr:tRNA (N(6)-L-threonylcarbamoyladenosine(37)-C(2))-methylthiotransferase MtaB [Hyphomicrobium sp.]KAB2944078.1 MAG: tRNA (N(6)-L-threonylcarbamoyladenosine(37)-C(2))-methylthiotransferase MtaB [Hyphomicrobium sp.]MBZ0209371.1 tRNA (N(6)-L-threonylcarbamoyladenosine(37)-C(2))-methylthiotransferase MtaB [Hyphomicrobium sp.]